MSTRVLVVMRHATAEKYAATDEDRLLTEEGTREAAAAGAWLAGRGFRPDLALVSSAARAVATWEAVAGAAGWELEPELDASLYAGGPETALDVIRAADDVASLFVIGHNPTVAYLSQMLDDGAGDEQATEALAHGSYPPAALTVFEFAGGWADLDSGTASVTAFHAGEG